jgi:hypothetical protein
MFRDAILLGSAQAVSEAWNARATWAPASLGVRGAVLIGPGEAPVPLISRAPIWDALDLFAAGGASLILIDPPADGAAKRAVLTRASEAGQRRIRPPGFPRGPIATARACTWSDWSADADGAKRHR